MVDRITPKILLSHANGNANVRGLLSGLQANNMLDSFHTTVACFPNTLLYIFAALPLLRDFRKRTYQADIRNKTHTYPMGELLRMFASKLTIESLIKHETGRFSVDKVGNSFDSKVASFIRKHNDIDAVYAYEDMAYLTFEAAKQLGIKCIYDLPIAHWKYSTRLMQEEAKRMPEWAVTLGGGISDSDEKHARKDKELELADVVVCPSKFVKDSLPEWATTKQVIISPFGTPTTCTIDKLNRKSDKLRVLFAGSMGQRKGLGDLFEAIKSLANKNIELVVLGSLLAPMEFYRRQLPDFTYEPTRPHDEVLKLMRTCDVFCLPSIVEGRALVMQEAMSQGLPVIITPNTGGEDLVIEGETGFLVPIRSPHAIAEKVNWFVENKSSLPFMSKKARNHALRYTWEGYGNTIIHGLLDLL